MSAAHKNECPVAAEQIVIKSTGINAYFTAARRVWIAIVSVAQRLATNGTVMAHSTLLLVAVMAVVGASK